MVLFRGIFVLTLGLMGCAQAQKIALPPIALGGAWTTVALPETPLGIAVHEGEFWVCGANEMITRSNDGGATWALLHERKGGGMLFALGFTGKNVQAFGSGGDWLVSSNEGRSWSRAAIKPALPLVRVDFVTDKIAYGMGANFFGVTTDGGWIWHLLDSPAKQNKVGVVAMAVRNSREAAFLLWTGNVAVTSDGGRRWRAFGAGGGYSWDDLEVTQTGYRAYGGRMEGHNGAGEPGFVQADFAGPVWTIGPTKAAELQDCRAPGCLVDGGWTDMKGFPQSYWALPNDKEYPLTGSWANAGDTFCRVSEVLRCRRAPPKAFTPTQPVELAGAVASCRQCPPPKYPMASRMSGEQGTVVLRVQIEPSGRIVHWIVLAAPGADLAAAAIGAMRAWRYAVTVLQPVEGTITFNFRLH